MEQLRDVVTHLLRLAGPNGVSRTVLVKLVYFSELQSWRDRGQPLTGVSFYRFHYGAWAPDVREVAESLPWVEHKWYQRSYLSKEYRLGDGAPITNFPQPTLDLLQRVFDTYGKMTASYVGQLSKQTEPMLATAESGETLDLSIVAPAKTFTIMDASLAAVANEFDFAQWGTREELDARDREVLARWAPLQARAMHDKAGAS